MLHSAGKNDAWRFWPRMDPKEAEQAYGPKFILGADLPITLLLAAIFFLPPVRRFTGADPWILAGGFSIHLAAHLPIAWRRLHLSHPVAAEVASQASNLTVAGAAFLAAGSNSLLAWFFFPLLGWLHATANGKAAFGPLSLLAAPLLAAALGHGLGREPLEQSLGSATLLAALSALVYAVVAYYKEWAWDVKAKAVDQAAKLTEARERARIASDLHGSLGAALTEITLWQETALAEAGGSQVALEKAQARARAALGDLRAVVGSLEGRRRPLSDWAEIWRETLAGACRAGGIRFALRVEGDPAREVDEKQAYHLGKFAQEAVTNAVRHARPASVTVEVAFRTGLFLSVCDDGAGFLPETAVPGRGLRALAEHAEALGGKLALESRPGGGARVAVELPAGGSETRA